MSATKISAYKEAEQMLREDRRRFLALSVYGWARWFTASTLFATIAALVLAVWCLVHLGYDVTRLPASWGELVSSEYVVRAFTVVWMVAFAVAASVWRHDAPLTREVLRVRDLLLASKAGAANRQADLPRTE